MADQNSARKSKILARAQKAGNAKVLAFVKKSFFSKMDSAGEHAGVWIEDIEKHFDRIEEKPEGLLKGFEKEDFDVLFHALFGVDRE